MVGNLDAFLFLLSCIPSAILGVCFVSVPSRQLRSGSITRYLHSGAKLRVRRFRRCQLLRAGALTSLCGPVSTDAQVHDALRCSTRTVANLCVYSGPYCQTFSLVVL